MRMSGGREPIEAQKDPEAIARVAGLQPGWLDLEIRLARDLAAIDRKRAFLFEGAASVEELAARQGYDGYRARDLALAGHALLGEPAFEDLLRRGQVAFAALIALGPLYRDPELLLEAGDDWVQWARFSRLRDLRRRVRRRVEALRQGRPVRAWTAHVTEETRETLEHARTVASRKARQALTRGQTLAVLAGFYVCENDPLGVEPRARRLPHTSQLPQDRYVPAEVDRALLARSGGICEFGPCERIAVERCHIEPHRDGSAREVEDLVHGCRRHHKQYDAHVLAFLGFTDDRRPVFCVTQTGEILAPKAWPEQRARTETQEWYLRAIGRWQGRARSGASAAAPSRRRPRRDVPPGARSPGDRPQGDRPPGDRPPNASGPAHGAGAVGEPRAALRASRRDAGVGRARPGHLRPARPRHPLRC